MTPHERRWRKELKRRKIHKKKARSLRDPQYIRLEQSQEDKREYRNANA